MEVMVRILALLALATGCSFDIRITNNAPPDDASPNDSELIDAEPPIDVVLPDAPNSCFQGAWCRRKRLEIPAGRAAQGPHASFPLLVSRVNDTDLAMHARDDGRDILFTDADGVTPLPYERQRFDGNTGQLLAWVRVPSLESAAPTVLYMYYGNAAASDQQQREQVWSTSFKGVWHLESSAEDSTQYHNNGVLSGNAAYDPSGRVGTSVELDAQGGRITMQDSASLDATASAGTFAMWIRFVDATTRIQLVMTTSDALSTPSDGFSWSVQADGDHYFYPRVVTDDYNLITNPFTDATWHMAHVAFDFANKSALLYVDGLPKTIAIQNVSTLWTQVANPDNWLWGSNPDQPTQMFLGRLDELRVQNVVRSPGWILTEFRNQSSPTTFVNVAPAELLQ